MNVLISGGSGFLGRALSDMLISQARQQNDSINERVKVTWLSRNANQDHNDDIDIITYEELKSRSQAEPHFDVIVNLAGAGIADSRWSDDRKKALMASRIKPTEAILEFIAKAAIKPKLLLSGSAVGWYGVQGDTPLDEASPANPDFAHKLCEKWEQLAIKATEFGVPVAIVRTGIVIHPEGSMVKRLLTPFKLGLGGKLGDGAQMMSWISREDWVRAAIFVINHQLSANDKITNVNNERDSSNNTKAQIFNFTAPNPVTNLEFTQALGRFVHRPTIMSLPAPVLKAMFGEMSTLLLEGQKVLPKALLESGFEFHQPTLEQALGINPR